MPGGKTSNAVADAVRTSLGPKGMDKMIQNENGEVLISNDGATILKQLEVCVFFLRAFASQNFGSYCSVD